jgi:hypothetical protein
MQKGIRVLLITFMAVAMMSTVYAAAFVDVPAKHWAYDAVTKLAKNGLVDGYGDGTFRGDKVLNRYEFAMIVGKMLDKYDKANVEEQQLLDKLSAEFTSELNKMGVRVAKVEAKTNNWVSGADMRFRYHADSPKTPGTAKMKGSDLFDTRVRIKIAGQASEDWSFDSRLTTHWATRPGNGEGGFGSTAYFDIFNLKGKDVLGLDSVVLGRNYLLAGNGLMSKADFVDGVWLNKTNGNASYMAFTGNTLSNANLANGVGDSGNANQVTIGQMSWKVNSNLNIGAGYYWSTIPGTTATNGINVTAGSLLATNGARFAGSSGFDLFGSYKFAGLTLLGEYIGTTLDQPVNMGKNPKGWNFQLSNGTGISAKTFYGNMPITNIKKAGDSAWLINYRRVESGAIPNSVMNYDTMPVAYGSQPYSVFAHSTDNVKGWLLAYEFVPQKNITFTLAYQTLKVTDPAMTPGLTSDKLSSTYGATLGFWW